MEFKKYIATCEVSGCENFNIPIEVMTVDNGLVMCGPCGTQIINIIEADS